MGDDPDMVAVGDITGGIVDADDSDSGVMGGGIIGGAIGGTVGKVSRWFIGALVGLAIFFILMVIAITAIDDTLGQAALIMVGAFIGVGVGAGVYKLLSGDEDKKSKE